MFVRTTSTNETVAKSINSICSNDLKASSLTQKESPRQGQVSQFQPHDFDGRSDQTYDYMFKKESLVNGSDISPMDCIIQVPQKKKSTTRTIVRMSRIDFKENEQTHTTIQNKQKQTKTT